MRSKQYARCEKGHCSPRLSGAVEGGAYQDPCGDLNGGYYRVLRALGVGMWGG